MTSRDYWHYKKDAEGGGLITPLGVFSSLHPVFCIISFFFLLQVVTECSATVPL